MIEVAFSVLVLAVGVVSVYLLYSRGLQNTERAMNETSAAMFADEAFNVMRIQSEQLAINGEPNEWETFWCDFAGGATGLPFTVEGAWLDAMDLRAGSLQSHVYRNYPFHAPAVSNITDHALRYLLTVDFHAEQVWRTNRLNATLLVWPGDFGATNVVEPFVFYSEIPNPDNM